MQRGSGPESGTPRRRARTTLNNRMLTMTSALRSSQKASAGAVGEFITDARIDALNRDLARHGVEAGQIITIFKLPAQPVANASTAKFRVLYRTA